MSTRGEVGYVETVKGGWDAVLRQKIELFAVIHISAAVQIMPTDVARHVTEVGMVVSWYIDKN